MASRMNEAQDHRYDPGYWLGGRIHPFYRRWAGLGTSGSFGVGLSLVGLSLVVFAVWKRPHQITVGMFVAGVLFTALGVSNLREALRVRARGSDT